VVAVVEAEFLEGGAESCIVGQELFKRMRESIDLQAVPVRPRPRARTRMGTTR
jgi:hypothetical protein